MVRVTGPQPIPAVLRQFGVAPAAVLTESGLEPTSFDDPRNLMSLAALGRLARNCVVATGCEHFGLLVGQQGGLDSLGLAGLLARHSPDVGTALNSLLTTIHLHNSGAAMAITLEDEVAIVSFDIRQPEVEAVSQLEDAALAKLFNVMRILCGAGWLPSEVQFAHRKPGDVRPYRKFFGAPLRFDCERNAIVFSRNWMARRLLDANAELRRLVQREIDRIDANSSDAFPRQVRSVLRAALLTGRGDAEQVAALFCIHSRTLSRRLKAAGTSFHALVDETRFEIASQLLQGTSMGVTQIATSLGYADTSAFTRAFRRWTGTTPARWRAVRGPQAIPEEGVSARLLSGNVQPLSRLVKQAHNPVKQSG